jgi:hypothetical protein
VRAWELYHITRRRPGADVLHLSTFSVLTGQPHIGGSYLQPLYLCIQTVHIRLITKISLFLKLVLQPGSIPRSKLNLELQRTSRNSSMLSPATILILCSIYCVALQKSGIYSVSFGLSLGHSGSSSPRCELFLGRKKSTLSS